jgi:hypothetical protein
MRFIFALMFSTLLLSSRADALPIPQQSCSHDSDCVDGDGNALCDGVVCQNPNPDPDGGMSGFCTVNDPGYCTSDDNCKCKGLGAVCDGNHHCSLTQQRCSVDTDCADDNDRHLVCGGLVCGGVIDPDPDGGTPQGFCVAATIDSGHCTKDEECKCQIGPLAATCDPNGHTCTATTCSYDTDCSDDSNGGTVCGGLVCGSKTSKCLPASSDPGFCGSDDDCKCKGLGAICDQDNLFCTITQPPQSADMGSSDDMAAPDMSATPPQDMSATPPHDMAKGPPVKSSSSGCQMSASGNSDAGAAFGGLLLLMALVWTRRFARLKRESA